MKKLRVLYVPNEAGNFRQLGFRRPLANLVASGQIAEASVFSLQWRIQNGGDAHQHRADLVQRVKDFQPNLILMQHLSATGLRDRHFSEMRKAAEFELVYHEADPYSRFLHPLPSAARAAGRASDVVYTIGTGTFSQNFRRAGAKDVRWSSHVFEPERYRYAPVDERPTRPHDVVIVANRNNPRLRGHPNWKDRIRFVELMQDRFGDRLAIYGRGWKGTGAKGPVDFSSQNQAIRSAWVSANWDHYADEPSYFSNRLPISLAAGSIHATTHHPMYNSIFPQSTRNFLLTKPSVFELVDAIDGFLENSTPAERIQAAKEAQIFAYENYRQDDQLVVFLNSSRKWIDVGRAASDWNIDSCPLSEV